MALTSFAQNGPGGVGSTDGTSSLSLWLKADEINQISGTTVNTWLDKSGYENDAIGIGSSPMLLDNQLHGLPTVNFSSANNQLLKIANSSSLNADYVSVFVVGRMNQSSGSKGTYLVKTTDKNLEDGYGLIRMNSKEKVRFFAGNYGLNRDSEHFHYGIFDLVVGTFRNSGSDKITAMVNNYGSSSSVPGSIVKTTNDMYLGATPRNASSFKSYLDGDIAEVVVLNKNLPSVERIIIANYLASKYQFGISNAKYSYYHSHSHEVIGIGKYDGEKHSQSIAGMLELKESKSLVDGQFLFIGHDGGSMNSITTNLPEEYSQRFERTWRSHVNGGIKKETLKFHIDNSYMPTDTSDYALLLDLDGDGDFSNADVIKPSDFDLINNTVSFEDIKLRTGAVFTLAFYKSIEWLGNSGIYVRGSGPNNEPNHQDGGRKLVIRSGIYGHASNDASVYTVVIEPGAGVVLDPNVCITINSNIHNDGLVIIEEDASLIQNIEGPDANSGNGTYVLKRTGLNSQYGYNNWSSPMKHVALDSAFPNVNYCDLLTFNEYKQDWSYDFYPGFIANCNGNQVTFSAGNSIAGGDGYMDITRGYFITGNTTNPQKEFIGTINNGDITTTIVATEYGDNINWDDDDWNFVGNPYPSALDPYAFWYENAVNNHRIKDAIHFWDDLGIQGAAYDQYNDYSSWNLTGGISSDNSNKVISNLDHIASGQGFMVWASDSLGTDSIGHFRSNSTLDTVKLNTLVFNNSMRSCKNSLFFKTAEETKELNWLKLTSPSGEKSKLLLGTVHGATDKIDNSYDARRVTSSVGKIEFSSLIGNSSISYHIQGIEPLNALNSDKTVRLKVVSNEIGSHTISRAAYKSGGAPLKMYLKDNLFNTVHDFDNGDYTFYLNDTNTNDISRFEILFEYDALNNSSTGSKGGVTSIEEVEGHMNIRVLEKTITISSNYSFSGELSVYDISGKLIHIETIPSLVTTKDVYLDKTTGVYLVKLLDTNGNSYTQRIVLQ